VKLCLIDVVFKAVFRTGLSFFLEGRGAEFQKIPSYPELGPLATRCEAQLGITRDGDISSPIEF